MKKYEFTDDFYSEFARILADKIHGKTFWSGYVDMSFDTVDVMFNGSLVINSSICWEEEYKGLQKIDSVSPIWWSIEVSLDGEDIDHDFDFDNVREYLEW